MSLIFKALIVAGCLYVIVLAAMYFGQRSLMYQPDATRVDPGTLGLGSVKERILAMPDGTQLIAWTAPASTGKPTIFYLHGNAGNLASRAEQVRRFRGEGWGVFFLSYRGYGGSSGAPSEKKLVGDALAVFDILVKEGVPATDIVLFGESLGTGVATQVAAQRPAHALILDAPYTSMARLAGDIYPWLPIDRFILDRYETLSVIGLVKMPILVLHGLLDHLVPVAMGKAVFAAAPEPKQLKLFPKGTHVDLFDNGALDTMRAFLARVSAR
jgi:fermentation-respiration switch protein FrsA (DUF1100 family)